MVVVITEYNFEENVIGTMQIQDQLWKYIIINQGLKHMLLDEIC
jgi:hypothetical protein